MTPIPAGSPAVIQGPPYRCSSDTVQLVPLPGSVCSRELQFRSVLTLLKLLVIKHVTTRARATSDPARRKKKKNPNPLKLQKPETKHILTGGLGSQGGRAPSPAAQPRREAPPRPAALATQKGQVAHGSRSFPVPHHRASANKYC